VLPLVPGYISFVTGEGAAAQGDRDPDAKPLLPVLLFILGFTLVFTLVFGFTASAASRFIRSDVGQKVAGGFVIAFGLFILLYAFRARMTWLYREERPLLYRIKPGPAGALPLGMAFAVGWTPCIGPVLGAVATLALGQGSTLRAVLLLLAYSAGLGVPFFLVGMGITKLMGAFRFFSRHYRAFAAVSGAVLVVIGVLLVSGLWVRLLSPVLNEVNRFTPPI
jgi:cytochrome c-type biogenesis protein